MTIGDEGRSLGVRNLAIGSLGLLGRRLLDFALKPPNAFLVNRANDAPLFTSSLLPALVVGISDNFGTERITDIRTNSDSEKSCYYPSRNKRHLVFSNFANDLLRKHPIGFTRPPIKELGGASYIAFIFAESPALVDFGSLAIAGKVAPIPARSDPIATYRKRLVDRRIILMPWILNLC